MSISNAFREAGTGGDIGIGVDIVSGCNLHCAHCYYNKSSSKTSSKVMPVSLIKNLIDQVEGRFSELYLLGGEPTLHPQLYEIIAYGLRHMKLVVLVTNGLKFADAEFCKHYATFGATMSMHRWAIKSQGANIVDQLSRKKGTFDRTEQAWSNIQKFWRGDICVQINLLRPLVEDGHVMDVFRWAREFGYKPIIEMIKASDFFRRNNNFDLTVQEVYALFRMLMNYDQVNYPELVPKAIIPPVYGSPCTLIEIGIHVLVDGTAILCVGHAEIPLCNVFKDGIDLAIHSPIRMAVKNYKTWIVGPCRECEYFDLCHGGCRGNANYETGCPRASNPYCWHHHSSVVLKDLVPKSCEGCPLEKYQACGLHKNQLNNKLLTVARS